jgi:hypothetical protein
VALKPEVIADHQISPSGSHPTEEKNFDDVIDKRIRELTAWLRENAPECSEEQQHLDEGTAERVYWHYGYLIALRDVRDFLRGKNRSLN